MKVLEYYCVGVVNMLAVYMYAGVQGCCMSWQVANFDVSILLYNLWNILGG